jgi:hypothetical protein
MLGAFRRRPGLQTGHRSRRKSLGWIALGAALAIVIGEVAADVVNSSGPAALMEARTFATAVVPLVDESNGLVTWMTDIRRDPLKLGRLGIESALGRLVGGCVNVQQELAALGIPAPNDRAGQLISEAFTLRTAAARSITGGVALATGPGKDAAGAQSRFAQAATAIANADLDYRRYVASLPTKVRTSVPMPASDWAAAISWDGSASSTYAALLAASPSLQLQHNLVIVAVAVEPPPLLITGLPTTTTSTTTTTSSTTSTTSTTTTTTTTTTIVGATTSSTLVPPTTVATTTTTSTTTTTTTTTLQIPPPGSVSHLAPTSSIRVSVVVANAGNAPQSGIVVSGTLTAIRTPPAQPGSGGTSTTTTTSIPASSTSSTSSTTTTSTTLAPLPPPTTNRHTIASLAAGGSLEITLPKFAVIDGRYTLIVRLGQASETITLQVGVG